MISLLYFICYTIVMILSIVYEKDIGWYLAAAYLLTLIPYIINVMMPFKLVYSIKEDDISFINISDVTDLPYGSKFLFALTLATIIFVPVFIPASVSIWLFYIGTVTVTYVYPAVKHMFLRVKLYCGLKKRGFTVLSGAKDLIFKGTHNVHYVKVKSQDREYKIGILGGIGKMKYELDGGNIKSTRVNSVLREYVLELEGTDSETIRGMAKHYLGKSRTEKLNTTEGALYLLLQQGSFIVLNGKFISRGTELRGMRLVDMTSGTKYIR